MATISFTNYGKSALPDTEAIKDVRSKYVDLYNQVDQAYTDLINAGRTSEAARLRESAERFARTGSELGVSPMARQAALDNLKTAMRVSGMQQEAQNVANQIGQKESILGGLSSASQAQFNQEMQKYSTALRSSSPIRYSTMSVNPIFRPSTASMEAQARIAAMLNQQRSNPLLAQAMNRGVSALQNIGIRNAQKGTSGAPISSGVSNYSGFGAKPASQPSTPYYQQGQVSVGKGGNLLISEDKKPQSSPLAISGQTSISDAPADIKAKYGFESTRLEDAPIDIQQKYGFGGSPTQESSQRKIAILTNPLPTGIGYTIGKGVADTIKTGINNITSPLTWPSRIGASVGANAPKIKQGLINFGKGIIGR